MAEAIIGIYQGNSWSRQHSRRSRFNIHWIMQAVGSTLSISGVLVQWFAYGKHHFNNYHAFLGNNRKVKVFFLVISIEIRFRRQGNDRKTLEGTPSFYHFSE